MIHTPKKFWFFLVLTPLFFMLSANLAVAAGGTFGGGDGSGGDPYQIEDCTDLQAMNNSKSSAYILVNDIDCSATSGWNGGAGFDPVGSSGAQFTGSFNGQGYVVRNLTINRGGTAYSGLFAWVNTSGSIQNVGLVNATVTLSSYSAPLVGRLAGGTVDHTYATGTMTTSGGSYIGGLVGYMIGGTVNESYSDVDVSGGEIYAGGLVGRLQAGTVQYSYSSGSVTSTYGGGMIGLEETGTVTASYYDRTTSGRSDNVGNGVPKTTAEMKTQSTFSGWTFTLVGDGTVGDWIMAGYPHLQMEHRTTIDSAVELQLMAVNLGATYSLSGDVNASEVTNYLPMGTIGTPFTGNLDGNGYEVSNLVINQSSLQSVGIIGYSNGSTITELGYVSGSVTGNQFVGGIVGYANNGSITKCYSLVDVTATNVNPSATEVGGLVGAKTGGTVADSYATGDISAAFDVGGLIGYNSATVARVYATGSVSGGVNHGGLIGRAEIGAISNSFATTDVQAADSNRNGLVGSMSGGASVSGSYWNVVAGGPSTCHSGGNTGCTSVSDNLSYFYEVTNAPMTSWTFPGTWLDVAISYPTLAAFGDVTAPVLSSTTPVTGTSFSDSDGNLILDFNEAVSVGSGNITIKNIDGSTFETISVTSENLTGEGTSTITVNPSSRLLGGVYYYVLIDATAFDDVAGNSYAGISSSSAWTFYVSGGQSYSSPPTLIQSTPSNHSIDVPLNSVLQLEFDRVIYFNFGDIEIRRTHDGSLFESFNIHGNRVKGFGSRIVSITPTKAFEPGETYYVVFHGNVFKDISWNTFPGFDDLDGWTFTTVQGDEMGAATLNTQDQELTLASTDCVDLDSSHWAHSLIQTLLAEGNYYASETGTGLLCRPNDSISRGEFIDWMVRMNFVDQIGAYTPQENEAIFTDLDATNPYYASILFAYEAGLVQGYPDGTIRSASTINRAEVLKITLLALDLYEPTEESLAALAVLYPTKSPDVLFVDVEGSEDWYYSYLYYATSHGVIQGRQQVNSSELYADMNAPTLFAEAAKILYLLRP